MTDKRQKATKVKCKRDESLTKQSIFQPRSQGSLLRRREPWERGCQYLWNLVFSRKAFEFCWSSFLDEHNTLPKSTRRNVKLNKFAYGTPWLPDLFFKHWFTSSVLNFCRWVADVPPRETSPAAKSEAKQMFSQANLTTSRTRSWRSLHLNWLPLSVTFTTSR